MPPNLERLFAAVGAAERLLILTHSDPDPDAIASAVALQWLLTRRTAVPIEIFYSGIIGRAENKALVRYLDLPLRRIDRISLQPGQALALVDTQPSAGNNIVPVEVPVAVVIDHHPPSQDPVAASFVDLRSDVGATSTVLVEYLQAAGLEPPAKLCTALFYGIKTDTQGLSRGTRSADVQAYFYLQDRIDVEALAEIEQAQVPIDYFRQLVSTLQSARVYDGVLIAYIGPMEYPDLTAEMADLLLRLEGIRWVVCMGVFDERLILSVRTRSRWGNAGDMVQAIVGDRGAAGGHGVMAGGQVPLEREDPSALAERFRQRVLALRGIPPDAAGQPLV